MLDILLIIAASLIFIPSIIFFATHSYYYIKGRKYVDPSPKRMFLNDYVTIIIPVRREPIEYIDEALNCLYKMGLNDRIEAIIISDDTYEDYLKIKELASNWMRKGLRVYVIWRSVNKGFRSGALNTALWFSTGKYVYVMDVDSIIQKEFLLKASSIMNEDPSVVAVVGRWSGKNKNTRLAEAITCSMNFVVDTIYRGRASLKLPLFVLGTGTLFRASYLKHVLKGWDEERYLADDLEISCRIMGKGGKVVFIDDTYIMLENPWKYHALMVQQERWVAGSLDVLIHRFKNVFKSPYPWYAKLDVAWYLLQYFPPVATLLGALILLILVSLQPLDYMAVFWPLGLTWSLFAGIYSYNYISSLKSHGCGTWKAIVNLGRSSAITVALSPVMLKAYITTILGFRMAYKRTPKGSFVHRSHGLRVPIEFIIGITMLLYGLTSIYKGLLFTGGWFLTYSLGYVYSMIRWWREIFFKPA